MKKIFIILVFLLFVACGEYDAGDFCTTGNMKCEDNMAMICEYGYYDSFYGFDVTYWVLYKDCNSINQICIYDTPSLQGGYTGLATCE